jgi:di/tricarboxylate transporter
MTPGGIFVPIIKFLSKAVGDDPEQGVRKKMGAFLMQSQLQQSSYSSALFLTSGAQNLLCLNLAAELGELGSVVGCVCVCCQMLATSVLQCAVCCASRRGRCPSTTTTTTHTRCAWHLLQPSHPPTHAFIHNPLKPGVVVPDAWMTWFVGCLPQAILGMVITPLLLFKLFPPEVGARAHGLDP